jgi:putative transposase
LNSSDGRYYYRNRRKYMLEVHPVLVTKYRRKLLQDRIASDIKQWIVLLAKEKTWNIAAIETAKDHVHILLDYDTT